MYECLCMCLCMRIIPIVRRHTEFAAASVVVFCFAAVEWESLFRSLNFMQFVLPMDCAILIDSLICYALFYELPTYGRIYACQVRVDSSRNNERKQERDSDIKRQGKNEPTSRSVISNAYSHFKRLLAIKFGGFLYVFVGCRLSLVVIIVVVFAQ